MRQTNGRFQLSSKINMFIDLLYRFHSWKVNTHPIPLGRAVRQSDSNALSSLNEVSPTAEKRKLPARVLLRPRSLRQPAATEQPSHTTGLLPGQFLRRNHRAHDLDLPHYGNRAQRLLNRLPSSVSSKSRFTKPRPERCAKICGSMASIRSEPISISEYDG